MVLWRISRHHDLSGAGGLRAAGRWHYAGHRVVYLAESPAGALLEVCVHTSANDIPPDFTLLKIEGPDLKVANLSIADLPEGWSEHLDVTRGLGTTWLVNGSSAMLRVPSVLVPETTNYLLNPAHLNASQFQIAREYTYPFDGRLKQ